MTARALVAECRRRGILLAAAGDRVHYDAPPEPLTADLRAALVAEKVELLAALREERPR